MNTNNLLSRVTVFIFTALTIYPIVFVMFTSLKSTNEFYLNVWSFPQKIEWANFSKAWVSAQIGTYFFNSLVIVGVSVIFIVILGAMAGYALAKLKIPYAEFVVFILLATTMLPSESVIMPLYIMMSKLRLIGEHYSLIIPYVGWGLPLTIYIFKSFFQTIPSELIEAARIDGCTETATFTKIISPLMLPAILTCAIFNFVFFWGELLWASIVLSSNSSLRTIPLGVLAFKSQFATDWGPLSAAICIVLLPLIFTFLFVQKYFVQGITGGAVKG
jgi:raffinose/stachyose/melibiose transport system permease protein